MGKKTKNKFLDKFNEFSNKEIKLPKWTQDKKDKRFIAATTLLALSATAIISTAIGVPISNSIKNKNRNEMFTFNTDANTTLNSHFEEIVPNSEKQRKINNEWYQTEMKTKFYNQGFRYPGFDYKYNDKRPNSNKNYSILEVEENGEKKEINLSTEIYKREKFNYQSKTLKWNAPKEIRWNNFGFVLDMINNKTLKKHPAVENIYRDMVSDNVKSITKKFKMNTDLNGKSELGLYVPPGEIAELHLSDDTYNWIQENQTIPFDIVLNNSYWDGKQENNNGNYNYPISDRYHFMKLEMAFSQNEFLNSLPDDPKQPDKKIFPKLFKIGSPFGGTISFDIKRNMVTERNPFFSKTKPISFLVEGAVPTLHYLDGNTTKEMWDNSINKIKKKELAPFITTNSFFVSFSVHFNSNNKQPNKFLIGGIDIDELIFPKETFKKWFDFFYIVFYFSNDNKRPHKKTDMQFCDGGDLWGGASGWGGGDWLGASINWAVISFLMGPQNLKYGANWGVYHEINHNFDQSQTLFKKKSHGQTNQLSMVALSMMGDYNRFRNEFNLYTGEEVSSSPRHSNLFALNEQVRINPNARDEYALDSQLLYTLGGLNYANYVRFDDQNHRNTDPGWTGYSEIINLSNYFKLNLVHPIEDYGRIWKDWTTPLPNEQLEIEKIKKDYKAMDFVANFYASGAYIYDNDTNKFYYGGDSNPAYSINFGEQYIFDFENFISSGNEKFKWTKLEIPSKTKYGATLKKDPTNPKKVIYIPNYDDSSSLYKQDEFDISIFSDNYPGQPTNYINEYKWKIKLQPELFVPTIQYFDPFVNQNNSIKNYLDEIQNSDKPNSEIKPKATRLYPEESFITSLENTKKEGQRLRFKYIVPETASYNISFLVDDAIRATITDFNNPEDKTIHEVTSYSSSSYILDNSLPNKPKKEFKWKKGQIIDFDLVGVNNGGRGGINMKLEKLEKDNNSETRTKINYIKDSLAYNIDQINDKYYKLPNISKFKTDERFKYKFREVNLSKMPDVGSRFVSVGEITPDFIDWSKYEVYYDNKKIPNLTKYDENWQKWGVKNNEISLDINFKDSVQLSGLVFGHVTNNHFNGRPKKIKITNTTNSKNEILYDGIYGKEFNDRNEDKSFLNFNKTGENVSSIRISMWNYGDKADEDAILFSWIRTYSSKFIKHPLSLSIPSQSSHIKYSSGWLKKSNSYNGYNSKVGYGFVQGSGPNKTLEFNIFARGFSLIGVKKVNNFAIFDVYINDKLLKENITTESLNSKDLQNDVLFSYIMNNENPKNMKVKLVLKSGELNFNYINVFGDDKTKINS